MAVYVGDAPVVSIPIAVCLFFLGTVFYTFIGPDAVDMVKMPFGLDLPVGSKHGAGTVELIEGIKMLQVPLWRSYLAGCILLGIAPCLLIPGKMCVNCVKSACCGFFFFASGITIMS